MPLWITAIGIASIGVVFGYILLYVLKRCLPPISHSAPALKEIVFLLSSLGIGGAIGATVSSLEGINYIGPYGIGLLIGFGANIGITLRIER